MRTVIDEWMKDLPSQFQLKKNIDILINAFARQLQELEQVYDDLSSILDVDAAIGENLDYVGTIIPLTRKEAYTILRREKDAVITDDVYRQVLKYKMLNNTSECTYYDITESIHMLWDTENIKYIEDPDSPATIKIAVKDADIDGVDALYGRATAIKPAGVKMVYTHGYNGIIDERGIESFAFTNVLFHIVIDFLRHDKMLDGSKLLDGTNILDGISSAGIRVGIVISGYFAKNTFSATCNLVIVSANAYNNIQHKEALKTGFRINFWRAGFLDGDQILDGSHFLDSSIGQMRAFIKTGYKINGLKNEVGTVSVATYNKDYKLLRGTKNLDGSKLLNSIYRKEDVQ